MPACTNHAHVKGAAVSTGLTKIPLRRSVEVYHAIPRGMAGESRPWVDREYALALFGDTRERGRERKAPLRGVVYGYSAVHTPYLEAYNKGVSVGRPRSLLYPLLTRIRVSLGDVLADRSLEQNWFLADVADLDGCRTQMKAP